MIQLTDNAKEKIMELNAEERDPNVRVRLYIQGGGCSGFNYGFIYDKLQDDDWDIEGLLVDSTSMTYLEGSTLDYKSELFNSGFVVDNPNAIHTCGCGNSFAI